jgi:DNA-directed RNA polymerase subunit L
MSKSLIFSNYEKITNDEKSIKFQINNMDLSIVNSLRRTILADIENVAFPFEEKENVDVNIKTNTSPLHNEIMKQRLALVPINLTEDEILNYKKYDYKYVINVHNKTFDLMKVTSGDIKILDKNGKEMSKEYRDRVFPKNEITGEYIVLTKLKANIFDINKGGKFLLEAYASKGSAKKFAGYSTVSKVSFHNVVDDDLAKKIFDEKYKDLSKDEKEKKWKTFSTLDIQRYFKKNEYGEANVFEFLLDSECHLKSKAIFFNGFMSLIRKVIKLKNNISDNNDKEVKLIHELNNIYKLIIYNENDTLVNMVSCLLYNKYIRANGKKEIKFVGYYQPHPLEKLMVLKLDFEDNVTEIEELLIKALESIKNDLISYCNEWIKFSGYDKENTIELKNFKNGIYLIDDINIEEFENIENSKEKPKEEIKEKSVLLSNEKEEENNKNSISSLNENNDDDENENNDENENENNDENENENNDDDENDENENENNDNDDDDIEKEEKQDNNDNSVSLSDDDENNEENEEEALLSDIDSDDDDDQQKGGNLNNEYIRVVEEELIRAKYYYKMKKRFENIWEDKSGLSYRHHHREDLHKEKLRKILNSYLLIPLAFKKNKIKNEDPLFITEKVDELKEQLYNDLKTYNKENKFRKHFNDEELEKYSENILNQYWDMMVEYSEKIRNDISKLDIIDNFNNDIRIEYNVDDKGTTRLRYNTKSNSLNGIFDDYMMLHHNKIIMDYYGYKAYGTEEYLSDAKNRAYLFASYFRYKYIYIDNQSLAYDYETNYETNDVGKEYKKDEVTECFSTPFNRYFDHFCSAFPDVDGHFGSLGSYFDRMREASKDKFEFPTKRLAINPPFVMNLMDLALDLALATFKKKKNNYEMSFILPSWDQDNNQFMGVRRMTEWAEKNKKKVIFEKKIAKKGEVKFKNYFKGIKIPPCDIIFIKLKKIE